MATVRWTRQALDDLDAVCLYISRDNPKIARIIALRAFEATDRLAEFPLLGRIVPETGRSDVRELFIFNYRLIYRLAQSEIQVLTVHHGARLLRMRKR